MLIKVEIIIAGNEDTLACIDSIKEELNDRWIKDGEKIRSISAKIIRKKKKQREVGKCNYGRLWLDYQ